MSVVRTRIAPSPTGMLHVGTARAALFNELFARQQGGKFVLRIEDTDIERSSKEYEEKIIEGLEWLGLAWDEGPFYQSKRTKLYEEAIKSLVKSGAAYQEEGSEAIKLKVEPQDVEFEDLVRGKVKVNSDSWGGDFVIARSATDPVYHLAVVVDDADMKISHVIRGEDHLSNTARHILLQRALGVDTPQYAHLPLLLDDKRAKLSKRKGETSLLAFREQGFLPEAMLNYLALLGWNPGDDREFFTHDELIKEFDLGKVQKGGAVFSRQKLENMNKHYIRQLSEDELVEEVDPFVDVKAREAAGDKLAGALALEQVRAATLKELAQGVELVVSDWEAEYEAALLVWRKSDQEKTGEYVANLIGQMETLGDKEFSEKKLSEKLMAWIDDQGWGRGDVLWPMRVALTGREHSPGPFEVAAVLGKEETLRRLNLAKNKIL